MILEIYQFKKLKAIMSYSATLIDDEPIELLDLEGNREQRRHGLIGKDGYKRPKSNKKLYEY